MAKTEKWDDILRSQFCAPPTIELRKALGCIVYVMLVLALALLKLKRADRNRRLVDRTSGEQLRFGPEQVALETALITSRVLLEFLDPSIKQKTSTHPLKMYYESLHKWTAHLTWQRVRREPEYKQPRARTAVANGRKILADSLRFVDECMTQRRYVLTVVGRKYYRVFLEHYHQLNAR